MLRTAVSTCCLVACITFLALWGRSFYWNDNIWRHQSKGYWHLRSWEAGIEFYAVRFREGAQPSFGVSCISADEWKELGGRKNEGPEAFGFGWGRRRQIQRERWPPTGFLRSSLAHLPLR
jgi:hypothetical protein